MTSPILTQILAEARAAIESPGITTGHLDPSRHVALSPRLFFKKIRPSGQGFECHDLACELFCSRLAAWLSLPVPTCAPVTMPSLGLGLISAFAGQKTIAGIPFDTIGNAEKLAAMFVFEQIVLNSDDKVDHFRMRDLPSGKSEFSMVDHGHTLHAWRVELQDPAVIDTSPGLMLPSSGMNEYRVQNYSQLQHHVRDLAPRAAELTGPIVDEVFNELKTIQASDSGLQKFVAEELRHRTIITKIIQMRAKNLDQIIRLKCQQSNIRIDSEQTTAPMAGVAA